MQGIPLLEKVYWFIGVCSFVSFVIFGLLFSKFLGLKDSKIYRISISCFQGDTDPIYKNFKNSLDGSSGLFGARLFGVIQNYGFPIV